jgi:hypothetical protein
MNNNRAQKLLNEIGHHDQYNHKYDLFVLDGVIVTTPAHAVGHCRTRHRMDKMETHVHLSRLVQAAPEA